MSSAFLILFYIALACLVLIMGRQMLFPTRFAPAQRTIFDIPVIAQGARQFIAWIPSIIRMTLVNIAAGIGVAIHAVGQRLDSYRHRHENAENEK